MIRKIGMVAALMVMLGTTAFFGFKGQTYTVVLEKEQIQEAIDRKMPYEKRFALFFTLTVKNTRVILTEGSDRIGAATDLELAIDLVDPPQNLRGYVETETGMRYDPQTYCFYLLEPEITKLEIQGIKEKYTQAVSVGSKDVLRQFLRDVAVYQIKDKDHQTKLARAVLKNVTVNDGRVLLTLGY